MIFDKVLGVEKINEDQIRIKSREAVRAVIIHNNKILMVHNNKGDYKFPGGGLQLGESHEEALRRELQEETGYIMEEIREKIGTITERKLDKYDKNALFQMVSYYYLCDVPWQQTLQSLDDYEAELGFHPVWIDLDEVIKINEEEMKKEDRNPWIERETIVLKELRKEYRGK